MFAPKSLEDYMKKANEYLQRRFPVEIFIFNHFGLKAASKDNYKILKKELLIDGKLFNEIFWNKKHISTIKNKDITFELSEPMPNDNFDSNKIDHISFVTKNFDKLCQILNDEAISKFDVGETHGVKISPQKDLIIEIRNNDIVDSVKDFAK